MRRLLNFSIICLLAVLYCSAGEVVWHIRDFGAKGDGVSDDGPVFRQALSKAKSLGRPVRLLLERKTYRISYQKGNFFALSLEDAKDITIDGRGALLLFHPSNMALQLYKCRNVRIKNLRIDYHPLPCTQGRVVRVEPADGSFVVEIREGFPLPSVREDFQPAYRHGCFLSGSPPYRYTHNWCYIERVSEVDRGIRLFRITVSPPSLDSLKKVEEGQIFVFRNPLQPPPPTDFTKDPRARVGKSPHNEGVFLNPPIGSIQIRYSRDCLLENIEQYISPGMSIFVDGSEGIIIRHFAVKPGEGRLCASLSDGIHCKGNASGPFIEDCYFQGLWDDSINLGSTPADVIEERISAREFKTRTIDIWWIDSYLRPGQKVQFWDRKEGRFLGERRIVKSQFLGNQKRIITVDRGIEGVRDEKEGREYATLIYILPGPSAVRRCIFRSQLKTAILPASGTLVEGNRIEDCAYGINACLFDALNLPFPWTQSFPQNLVIKGNTFRNVGISAITLYAGTANPSAKPLLGNILIEGNRIYQRDGSGIVITNVKGVTIKGNLIEMDPATPPGWKAIELHHCAGIYIADTYIQEPRHSVPAVIYAPSTPRSEIKMQNVEIKAPGDIPIISSSG